MRIELDVQSRVLGKSTKVTVIYPYYDDAEGLHDTLYLLHGLGDDNTSWSRYTNVEVYANDNRTLVVMPDGDVSWYRDMRCGLPYFTYITEELPAKIEFLFRHAPLGREHTIIGGASMGGYGAFTMAMRRPDLYSRAFAFSGALDLEDLRPWISQEIMYNAWGPFDEALKNDCNPFVLASGIDPKVCPELYMWCGTDDFLYSSSVKFRDHAESLGLPLHYEEGPGSHIWPCWDIQIKKLLDRITVK